MLRVLADVICPGWTFLNERRIAKPYFQPAWVWKRGKPCYRPVEKFTSPQVDGHWSTTRYRPLGLYAWLRFCIRT
jgi:hypothetical protein